MKVLPYHINDKEFANALVDSFLDICRNSKHVGEHDEAVCESIEDTQEDSCVSELRPTSETISYSLSNFPNANPGKFIVHSSSLFMCLNINI